MIRFYVPTPRPLLPIRNTDWVYPRQLAQIPEHCSSIRVNFAESLPFDVWTHARFALNILKRRYRMPVPPTWTYTLSEYFHLLPGDKQEAASDVIFSFERYPENAKIPVLWMTGATDVDKLRGRGLSEAAIQQEIDFKREAADRAAVVALATRTMQAEFERLVQPRKPTALLRYFIFLQEASLETVEAKWARPEPIRLLFIGRAAHRKGLPLVLDAYTKLRSRLGDAITLHVATEACDGPIIFPDTPGLTHEGATSKQRTTELMHASHFLLLPSKEENYPLVVIEALASGVIPMASDRPNQREQLHDGQAGLLVERNAEAIAADLLACIENRTRMQQLVTYGRQLWTREYHPAALSGALYRLAQQALQNA